MSRKKSKEGSVVLCIRIPKSEYMWIKEIAVINDTTISTLSKLMIDYFIMAHALGLIKTPLPEIRKKFISILDSSSNKTKGKEDNSNKH